jgi:hypothetical protein
LLGGPFDRPCIWNINNINNEVTQKIFKVAPTFMSGIAKLQNKFGFSQNDAKIVA